MAYRNNRTQYEHSGAYGNHPVRNQSFPSGSHRNKTRFPPFSQPGFTAGSTGYGGYSDSGILDNSGFLKAIVCFAAVAVVGILFLLPAINRASLSRTPQGLAKIYNVNSDKTAQEVDAAINSLDEAKSEAEEILIESVDSAKPLLDQLHGIQTHWTRVKSRVEILDSDLVSLEQEGENLYPSWNDVAESLESDYVRNREIVEHDVSRRDFHTTLSESRSAVDALKRRFAKWI